MTSLTNEEVDKVRERVAVRLEEFGCQTLHAPSLGIVRLMIEVYEEIQAEQDPAWVAQRLSDITITGEMALKLRQDGYEAGLAAANAARPTGTAPASGPPPAADNSIVSPPAQPCLATNLADGSWLNAFQDASRQAREIGNNAAREFTAAAALAQKETQARKDAAARATLEAEDGTKQTLGDNHFVAGHTLEELSAMADNAPDRAEFGDEMPDVLPGDPTDAEIEAELAAHHEAVEELVGKEALEAFENGAEQPAADKPIAPAVPRQRTHEVKLPRTLAEVDAEAKQPPTVARVRQLDELKTKRRLDRDRRDREQRDHAAANITYDQVVTEIKRISMANAMPTQTQFNMSKPAPWPTANALMGKLNTSWEALAEECGLEWSRGRKNVPSAA
jgi:hypothetical protein